MEGPRHSIGTKGGSGNCLYCTGVDSDTIYLNADNSFIDKPLQRGAGAGRNYLTSKDTESPKNFQSKQSELFDLENDKVGGQESAPAPAKFSNK